MWETVKVGVIICGGFGDGCVIAGAIFGVGVEVGDLPPTPSVTAPVSVALVFVTTRLWICYCLWRRD
jgi:hypothetical protein